jgi:archaellum component FlaG (FlaF/FlaG flagellin family)
MSTYTATLTITDVTGPVVDKITYKTEGSGSSQTATLYVFFNENVDGTGTSKASYATTDTNGKLTTLSKDPAFFDGNKVVKIELTAAEWDYVKARGLIIMKVKDVLGNESVGQTYAYGDMENYETDKPKVAAIEVVASNKVVVKFDQYLRRVDSDAFTLMRTTPASMELSEEDGKTVVILYVNTEEADEILADASNVVVVIDAEDDDVKVLNIFDLEPVKITFDVEEEENDEKVKDKIAPSITKDDKDDYNIEIGEDGTTIKITFDEDIDGKALSTKTFEVKDKKIDNINAVGEVVTITLATEIEEGETITLTQESPVYDIAGNKFKLDKSVDVTRPEESEETGE